MSGIEIKKLEGITSCVSYPDGQIETCRFNLPNVVSTPYGDLIPKYSPPGIRDKDAKSLSFHKNGAVRAVVLEAQTDIFTPLGTFPAELVTFDEDGALDSVFPLNGQIGFGWSEREEKALAQAVRFDFPFGSFETKPIGLRFYPNGNLKSLILWPEEIVSIETPLGTIPVRIGFKLFENGSIESVEPARPVGVPTPIGKMITFDPTAVGVDADINSLRFDPDGNLAHLATLGDIIVKSNENGGRCRFSSRTRIGLSDDNLVKLPLHLSFYDGFVRIDDGNRSEEFEILTCEFLMLYDFSTIEPECGGQCDGCALC